MIILTWVRSGSHLEQEQSSKKEKPGCGDQGSLFCYRAAQFSLECHAGRIPSSALPALIPVGTYWSLPSDYLAHSNGHYLAEVVSRLSQSREEMHLKFSQLLYLPPRLRVQLEFLNVRNMQSPLLLLSPCLSLIEISLLFMYDKASSSFYHTIPDL